MDISDYVLVFHVKDDPEAVEPDSISVPSDYDNPLRNRSGSKVPKDNPHYVTMEDYLRSMESSYNRARINQWINDISSGPVGYDQEPYYNSSVTYNYDGQNFYPNF